MGLVANNDVGSSWIINLRSLFVLWKTCSCKMNYYCYSNSVNLSSGIERCCIGLVDFSCKFVMFRVDDCCTGIRGGWKQQFWLEGWRCYCTEGHNTARGTKKASKTDLPALGVYNLISLCRLQFQLEISKGVTVATAGSCRSSEKDIRHSVFSVSTPTITESPAFMNYSQLWSNSCQCQQRC